MIVMPYSIFLERLFSFRNSFFQNLDSDLNVSGVVSLYKS